MALQTNHMDAFQHRGGKPSHLNPELAKDLRSHHSSLGIDANDWGTTYKNAHYWKQPVAED